MTLRVEQVAGRSWQWRVTLCWCGGVCDGLEVAALVEAAFGETHEGTLTVLWPAEVTWMNPVIQGRIESMMRVAVRQSMREAAHVD